MPTSSAHPSIARPFLALLVWAGAVLGALAVNGVVARHVRDQQRTAAASAAGGTDFSSSSSASGSTARPFDSRTVTPTDPRSLFHSQNLARVLAAVRAHAGPQALVRTISLTPGEMTIVVGRPNVKTVVYANANGASTTTDSADDSANERGLAFGQVDAATPDALARRLSTEGHTPLAQLKSMLLSRDPISHRPLWQIYTARSSTYFTAHGARGPITAYTAGASRTLPG